MLKKKCCIVRATADEQLRTALSQIGFATLGFHFCKQRTEADQSEQSERREGLGKIGLFPFVWCWLALVPWSNAQNIVSTFLGFQEGMRRVTHKKTLELISAHFSPPIYNNNIPNSRLFDAAARAMFPGAPGARSPS